MLNWTVASFCLTFQIFISCYSLSLPCPGKWCILCEFEGRLLSQRIKGERLGSQTSAHVKFVYNAISVELLGSGMGWRQVGCRGGSGRVRCWCWATAKKHSWKGDLRTETVSDVGNYHEVTGISPVFWDVQLAHHTWTTAEFPTSSPVPASRIKSKQVESGESRGWSHDWLNDQPPKGSNPKLVGFSLLLGGVPIVLQFLPHSNST